MKRFNLLVILCLICLLAFSFAGEFSAPSFKDQPLKISTTTDFFGSSKGLVTIDLNIENLDTSTKQLFVKIKGLESYKVNMEEIKVDGTTFETSREKEAEKQITDSRVSWSSKQLRKFQITLKFDPQEIGLAKKFDVQLIDDKGILIADLDPFLSGWDYRQQWFMDTNNISLSGDITNDHTIVFKKTSADTDFWGSVASDGKDVRFTDSSNNDYNYYFQDWNYITETMVARVKVTETFDKDDSITGYLYYGNSSATAKASTTGAFNSNLVSQYHFDESSGDLEDFASSNDATNSNISYEETGILKNSYGYNGTSSKSELDSTTGFDADDFSISLWARPSSTEINGVFFGAGSDSSNFFRAWYWGDGSSAGFSSRLMISGSDTALTSETKSTDFHHMVITYNGSQVEFYLNGSRVGSGIAQTGNMDFANSRFGVNGYTSSGYVDGNVDEASIWKTALTNDEAKLIYNSEKDNLVSFGSEEVGNSAPDLNVTSPTLNLNWNETKSITFDIFDAENNELDVNIYYSSSSGARTNLIYADTNLQDGVGITCNDYNFMVSRNCSYSWDTTTASDGQYYVDINASDGSSTAQASSPQFRVDNTDPETSFSGCGTGWNNTNQDINLSCTDAGSGCNGTTYRIDGGAWESYSTPFTLSTDLNHQIDFNSIDFATNQEAIKTEYCAIDKTAPSVEATTLDGFIIFGAFINGVGTILGGLATDILSGIDTATCEYTLNGGGEWLSAVWDTDHCEKTNITIVDGTDYNASTRVDDNAGNTGTGAYTGTYTGDTTAPTTTDNASNDWTNVNQNITLDCNDGSGAGCKETYYCVDEAGSCTPSLIGTSVDVTCTAGNVCLQYVRYFSQDNVDNNESVQQSVQIRIDKENPETTFSGCGTGWFNVDKEITLSCDDGSGSGCDATTYSLNGGAWESYSTPFTLSTDLNHQIDFNSIDAVSNTETIKTSYCAIDKTAPTYTSIDNNGIIFFVPFDIQINGVNFDLSGKALAQYRIDAGSWENFAIDYNVPITSDGNFLVDVNLVDNAGSQTLIENLEAFLMLPPNSTDFITPLEQTYSKGLLDNNLLLISWEEATHPASRPMTYDINYINSLGETTNLVASTSDLNYSWDITAVPDGNYWLVGIIEDDRGLTTQFELDYNFTIATYVSTPPSVTTTHPTGTYDKRSLVRVEFEVLDANQSSFLVDINYSSTSNFGSGTILVQDQNVLTSAVVECIVLSNNFSCYYDANLSEVADGDYYALVNVQGQGADASPQFNIYLGVDPEPAEAEYNQRYVNPNYSQRDENIYYNPATAYFLTDSEKQNIYLEQTTYLLIGVLIIIGIGVFLLWKRK